MYWPEGVAILNCYVINMSVLSRGGDKIVVLVKKNYACIGQRGWQV